jgi:hypothetical protein
MGKLRGPTIDDFLRDVEAHDLAQLIGRVLQGKAVDKGEKELDALLGDVPVPEDAAAEE